MEKIKCPFCNWEYLPCELYLPNSFLGKTANIVRDEVGEILAYDEDGIMDLKEDYRCDNCGKKFGVEAEVTFKTIKLEKERPEVFTVKL